MQTHIRHEGVDYSVEHLAPLVIACPCEPIGRALAIRVTFANHCYTEAFDSAVHERERIVLYDGPSRPRVFSSVRYGLSQKLPALIHELPTRKVHRTSSPRENYVYVVLLKEDNVTYEIYFMLQRAQAGDGVDLRLTVESAYPVALPTALPKLPRAIRFTVLAHKVLANQPRRFGPR
jgi:hypothetical protein